MDIHAMIMKLLEPSQPWDEAVPPSRRNMDHVRLAPKSVIRAWKIKQTLSPDG